MQSNALRHTKNFFPQARLIRFAPKKLSSDEIAKNNANKKQNYKYREGFFLGLGLGYASVPSTHLIQTGSLIVNEPSSSAVNQKVHAGYNFDNAFVGSINYLLLDTGDLVFNNVYLSLNYRFEDIKSYVPYFGVSAGISNLKWNTSPINEPDDASKNNSSTTSLGTQTGVLYEGFNPVSVGFEYNTMFMQHTTNITQDATNSSKLQHKVLHSVQFFIHYNFK
jgi:hypothetical protein